MKSLECKKELENQIKSNRSLIYITSFEEYRVDEVIQDIACDRGKPWSVTFWDISSGGMTNSNVFKVPENMDQIEVLSWFENLIIEKDDFSILVLHDFYKFLAPDGHAQQVEISTIRSLKNLIEKCNTQRKCVIITGAKYFLPLEFEKSACLIDWPLPDIDIISEKIKSIINSINGKIKNFKAEYTDHELEQITRAFQGLSLREIEMISAYFVLTDTQFCAQKISSKKRDLIKKSGILEWIDFNFDLATVGGLSNLKKWLHKRKNAFSESAREYGLPENPKGLLIIGIQGGGKSRTAKAISSFWGLPLLRLDIGRVFSGIVGSSEENLRSVISTAESVAPCILWCDEIDKAFGGIGHNLDSGTSSRIFGSFLVWMQEKKAPVFVVATANNVGNLPAELIRKGRFDEIFFVDLPDDSEREEIWKIHLDQRKLYYTQNNLNSLVEASDGFTGAEIEAAIISAMYEGFSDNCRVISSVDIIKELKESVPISITMKENIESLRNWSRSRARNASKANGSVSLNTFNHDEEL